MRAQWRRQVARHSHPPWRESARSGRAHRAASLPRARENLSSMHAAPPPERPAASTSSRSERALRFSSAETLLLPLCGDFWFFAALRQQFEQSIDSLIDGQRLGERNRRAPGSVQLVQLGAAIGEELNDLYDFGLRAPAETHRGVHKGVAAALRDDVYVGVELVRVLHGRDLGA